MQDNTPRTSAALDLQNSPGEKTGTARMIAETLSLTRWEWFKLRRRRLPWILLFVSVLLLQITFWSAYALFRVGDEVALGDGGTASVSGAFLELLAFPNNAVIGLAISHGFSNHPHHDPGRLAHRHRIRVGHGAHRPDARRRPLAVAGVQAAARRAAGRWRADRRGAQHGAEQLHRLADPGRRRLAGRVGGLGRGGAHRSARPSSGCCPTWRSACSLPS